MRASLVMLCNDLIHKPLTVVELSHIHDHRLRRLSRLCYVRAPAAGTANEVRAVPGRSARAPIDITCLNVARGRDETTVSVHRKVVMKLRIQTRIINLLAVQLQLKMRKVVLARL